MKNIIVAGALASSLCVGAASAAEITGGYFDLGYSSFTDSDDGSKFYGAGSGELGFTRNFSVQADLGVYRFREVSETAYNGTLHAIYHTNDNLSLGGYYNRDEIDGGIDSNSFGIEAGYETGILGLEGYVSRIDFVDSDFDDGNLLGFKVEGSPSSQFTLSASVDYLNGPDDLELTRFGVSADYEVGEGAHVYGELGRARVDIGSGSESETFIGAGLRLNFGAKRGTTFGRRGLLDKLPGA
ncbi:porin [Ruegeria hyattellae]|uniref:porin n=1 Tax=Ruegeria hyattellae TaxID=3233337 RepID=UPI00355C122B